MASGFPARFAQTRSYQLPDEELAALVKEVFDDLGWRHEIVSRTEFRARTPFMFLGSWGEHLKVEILLDGLLAVESKSIWPGFDSGSNKRNVQTFFARFEHAERMYRLVAAPHKPPSAYDINGLTPVERMMVDSGDE